MQEQTGPKVVNDVNMPNKQWHIVIGYLPWYVLNDNSPCPVSLPIIYDDYSEFIIWWRLLPVIRMNKSDDIQRSADMSAQICPGIATALYRTNTRPETIVMPRLAQHLVIERFLQTLVEPGASPIKIHYRSAKPRRRDQLATNELTRLLRSLPGSYKASDYTSIRAAILHDLLSIEEAVTVLTRHFKLFNEQLRPGKPSRFEIWRSAVSLPAPSVQRLVASGYLDLPAINKEGGVLG